MEIEHWKGGGKVEMQPIESINVLSADKVGKDLLFKFRSAGKLDSLQLVA